MKNQSAKLAKLSALLLLALFPLALARAESVIVTGAAGMSAVYENTRNPTEIRIEVRKNGRAVQTIRYEYPESCTYADMFGTEVRFADADFDGHDDILLSLGTYGVHRYEHCFLWSEAERKFVSDSTFEKIANPVIDVAEKCVYGFEKKNPAHYVYTVYRFQNGTFSPDLALHETCALELAELYGIEIPDGEDRGGYALKRLGLPPDIHEETLYVEEFYADGRRTVRQPTLRPSERFRKVLSKMEESK